jgi:hypothetical protein
MLEVKGEVAAQCVWGTHALHIGFCGDAVDNACGPPRAYVADDHQGHHQLKLEGGHQPSAPDECGFFDIHTLIMRINGFFCVETIFYFDFCV